MARRPAGNSQLPIRRNWQAHLLGSGAGRNVGLSGMGAHSVYDSHAPADGVWLADDGWSYRRFPHGSLTGLSGDWCNPSRLDRYNDIRRGARELHSQRNIW